MVHRYYAECAKCGSRFSIEDMQAVIAATKRTMVDMEGDTHDLGCDDCGAETFNLIMREEVA